ncbi:hypothetical protein SEVIR_2G444200v4 [Setaria viridis]|uniref:Peroxidase n=1 Tax=Setaria viridis TaxID=4556 RepID=A0A4U6W6U7_SETVI|nr:hypothetical protein SEVIR_2G444200v2 [Setaria viridis]
MASASSCLSLLLVVAPASSASAQLSSTFYDTSCPRALATIRSAVNAAVAQEARMGASLLRLHFHDCFVQGCDASVLLAGSERTVAPNLSLRGYEVIDKIKAQVEAICKQTVSCADILAVAARDSVVALGGPSWTVLLGRRDSTTAADMNTVLNSLPPPSSSLAQLIREYGNLGLNPTDMAALSGAHTIGLAHCPNYRAHTYNDANIDPTFARSLRANCPMANNTGGDVTAPLDTTTPARFDNAYYRNLLSRKGLLHSSFSTDNTVRSFASNPSAFSSAFAAAMVKMGNISPKTGSQGQIRLTCSKVN